MKQELEVEKLKKDRGWSWIVLGASFLTQMNVWGFTLSFGIYHVTLRDYFDTSNQRISLIGSMIFFFLFLSGKHNMHIGIRIQEYSDT